MTRTIPFILLLVCQAAFCPSFGQATSSEISHIRSGFVSPPPTARPGVYWYFMDGNRSRESMKKDLEAMKQAGIGNLIFLEVNVGVPRGPVDLLSKEWLNMFGYAVKEAERLGIEITLGIGPGWSGSGGPWVKPSASMQHLVYSTVQVRGPQKEKIVLSVPEPRIPYFGMGVFNPGLEKQWKDFYKDVAVIAFPTPTGQGKIPDIDEKALYYRAPFSSAKDVKPFLPSFSAYPDTAGQAIAQQGIIDLTDKLQPDGTLLWEPPAGQYTIMRFVSRNNGAITRPAPLPGLGFEADKLDTAAINAHLEDYVGKLLQAAGTPLPGARGGLKRLHMDSWEMGSQNWTAQFRSAFIQRRGYDPLPFYPVYAGDIVGSREISERFLWDLRLTAQELVLENHATQVKRYGRRHGLALSIEPYDMNPTADLELGAVADVPMGEFWSKGYGFNTVFSIIEATSIAHVQGKSLVPAESFTAAGEDWKQYPGSMKNQGDWALAAGINRFVFHTFQNQYLADSLKPGMTMGPYGVNWNRSQTWWPMVGDYHQYISRCSFVLQQGRTVADILYLTPEGAPQVFRPPFSALTEEDPVLPDRKGYNFDGCSPGELIKAEVKGGLIVFPSGASYRILVLPASQTMTPRLLEKVMSLVRAGATVVGSPPVRSPSLSGYPDCDRQLQQMVAQLWGTPVGAGNLSGRVFGKGRIIREQTPASDTTLYPDYEQTAALLEQMGVSEDFVSDIPLRYTHRTGGNWDIYFVSSRSDKPVEGNAIFRSDKGQPQLWDPLTGETRAIPAYSQSDGRSTIPLAFDTYQSFFVVFKKAVAPGASEIADISAGTSIASSPWPSAGIRKNFPIARQLAVLKGSWTVSFDPHWGGPAQITMDSLTDWSQSPEDGIRHYSGIARYSRTFDLPDVSATEKHKKIFIDMGAVRDMARVWLNGKDLGVIWTAPLQVNITDAVKQKGNHLVIEVANRWPNRLIGDEQFPDDGIRDDQWPTWLLKGQPRTSGRYTFATYEPYKKDSPLLPSGLLGPVTILTK